MFTRLTILPPSLELLKADEMAVDEARTQEAPSRRSRKGSREIGPERLAKDHRTRHWSGIRAIREPPWHLEEVRDQATPNRVSSHRGTLEAWSLERDTREVGGTSCQASSRHLSNIHGDIPQDVRHVWKGVQEDLRWLNHPMRAMYCYIGRGTRRTARPNQNDVVHTRITSSISSAPRREAQGVRYAGG